MNALLDFARIEAGRTKTADEPTDLDSPTADVASHFARRSNAHEASVLADDGRQARYAIKN